MLESSSTAETPAEILAPIRLSMQQTIRCVALACNVSVDDLIGPRHFRKIAWPRQIAMVLCYDRGRVERSLTNIGRQFGGRDHTTVLHALERWRAPPEQWAELYRRSVAAVELFVRAGALPEPDVLPHRSAAKPQPKKHVANNGVQLDEFDPWLSDQRRRSRERTRMWKESCDSIVKFCGQLGARG